MKIKATVIFSSIVFFALSFILTLGIPAEQPQPVRLWQNTPGHCTTRPHNRKLIYDPVTKNYFAFFGTGIESDGVSRNRWKSSQDGINWANGGIAYEGGGFGSGNDVFLEGNKIIYLYAVNVLAASSYRIKTFNIAGTNLIDNNDDVAIKSWQAVDKVNITMYGSITKDTNGYYWVSATQGGDKMPRRILVFKSNNPNDVSSWNVGFEITDWKNDMEIAADIIALDNGKVLVYIKDDKVFGNLNIPTQEIKIALYDPSNGGWQLNGNPYPAYQLVGPSGVANKMRSTAEFEPQARKLHLVYEDASGKLIYRTLSYPYSKNNWSAGVTVASGLKTNGENDISLEIDLSTSPASIYAIYVKSDGYYRINYYDGVSWKGEKPFGAQTGGAANEGTMIKEYQGKIAAIYSVDNGNNGRDVIFQEYVRQNADSIPPASITSLRAAEPTASSIALSWIAPGDDGNVGTASSYDIRYSLSSITETNWNNAMQASGEPLPLSAGANQSFVVTGLSSNTTYYFAIKAKDEADNISAISNVAYLKTQGLDVTPPTIPIVVDEGATTYNKDQLYAKWESQDLESGIAEYKYQITERKATNIVVRGWTSSGTFNYVTAGDLNLIVGKTYYFAVRAKNGIGMWSAVGYSNGITVVSSDIDTTPPVTTASPKGGTYTSAQTVTLTAVDSGGSGIDKTYYTLDGTSPKTTSPVYVSPITIEKTTTLKFLSLDKAGNDETVKTEVYTITPTQDTQAPSVPQYLTAEAVSSTQINLNWFASTDNVGVIGYNIYRGDSKTASSPTISYQNTGLQPLTTYNYKVSAYDAAGNESAKSTQVSVTTQPLLLSVTTAVLADAVVGSLYSQTLQAAGGITPYAWSITAGVLPVGLSLGPYTGIISGAPTKAESYNFTVQVRDSTSKIASKSLSIAVKAVADTTPPTTTASGIDDLWHNSNVTVTLTATDSGSGVDKTYYSTDGYNPVVLYTGPFVVSKEGLSTIKYYSLDKAGNIEAVKTAPIQVRIDKTAPVGSILINGGEQYAISMSVRLTLGAQDAVSGLAQMRFSNDNITYSDSEAYATTKYWIISSGSGTKTVYTKFKDAAGNWSGAVSDTIIFDATPPGNPQVTDEGASTVSTTQLKATWSSIDAESGIAEYQYAIGTAKGATDVVGWASSGTATSVTKIGLSLLVGKTYYFSVKAKNGIGMWSDLGYSNGITVVSSDIDTTPPVTTASPKGGTYTSAQTVTLTAVDTGSGIDKTYYTLDGTNPKTTSLVYLSPIIIDKTTTLKFFSVDSAGNDETAKTEVYTINPSSGTTVNINGSIEYQTIEGLGGQMESHPEYEKDTQFWDLLYKDVGVSAVRTGCTRPDVNDPIFQQEVLPMCRIALAYGLKSIGCGGAHANYSWIEPSTGKLLPDYYDDYANSILAYNDYIKSVTGVVNSKEALFPEPSLSYGIEPDAPCPHIYMDKTSFKNAITVMAPILKSQNLKIYIPTGYSVKDSYNYASSILPALGSALPYIDGLSTNGYACLQGGTNAQEWQKFASLAKQYNINEVWVPEQAHCDECGNPGSYADTKGLIIAQWLHEALAIGNAGTWMQWLMIDKGKYKFRSANMGGFVYSKYWPPGEFSSNGITKIGYAFKQFAHWVRPGAVRIEAASNDQDILASSYKHANDNTFTIVAINKGTQDKTVIFNIAKIGVTAVDVYRTSGTENSVNLGSKSIVNNSFTYVLPAESTTTFSGAIGGVIPQDTTAPVTTASPKGGTYTQTQNVTLSVNESAVIYYTTDGSTPTVSSTKYILPINISQAAILKFFAVDTAGNREGVKTETYTITSQNGNGKLIAGTALNAQIWVSADDGATWILKKDLSKESSPQKCIFSLAYDSYHDRLAAGTWPNAQIWVSADRGETWVLKKDLSKVSSINTYVRAITFDSSRNRLVAGTNSKGQIWISDDGGNTWVLKKDLSMERSSQSDIRSLTFDSYHNRLVAGTGPNCQIWVSADHGETWSLKKDLSKISPLQQQLGSLTFDSYRNRLVAGTGMYEGQIWVSADGGDTWTIKKDLSKELPPQPRVYSLTFDSQRNRIVAGTGHNQAQIWVSADGGDTWTFKKDFLTLPEGSTLSLSYSVKAGMLVAGTGDHAGQIWASKDGGDTWNIKKDLSMGSPSQTVVYAFTAVNIPK